MTLSFKEYEMMVLGKKGYTRDSPQLRDVIKMYEGSHKELHVRMDTNDKGTKQIFWYDPDTGEVVAKHLMRKKEHQVFKTKTIYTAEMEEDISVIYNELETYPVTKQEELFEVLSELTPKKSGILLYLINNLKGYNTGSCKRTTLRDKFGKDYTRVLTEFSDSGYIYEVEGKLSTSHILYKVNPHLAYKCYEGALPTMLDNWMDLSREYNHQKILSLPPEQRIQYQKYTVEPLS